MANIDVQITEHADHYIAAVTVKEGRGHTHHSVTVNKNDYDRLTGGSVTPKELVAESFRFLLEREPKESILRQFNLTVIGRYFPEYERQIRERLR
ncbi:MAG: hypothetical protein ACP5HM_13560 [Anaerolineae bacterium]